MFRHQNFLFNYVEDYKNYSKSKFQIVEMARHKITVQQYVTVRSSKFKSIWLSYDTYDSLLGITISFFNYTN